MHNIRAKFPEAFECLFTSSRYICLYGGRGSGKSWAVARALLLKGVQNSIRVLCSREVQNSIEQSVHQLLKDQISALGLDHHYEVQKTTIRGANGTEFYFKGLSDQTSASIKSFEGVDICWLEESQSLTDRSLDILIPTIRKPGSSIWLTFNPQLETDPVYSRFVLNPPDDCIVRKVNFDENPFFQQTALPAEMLHARRTMSAEQYNHIWRGECLPAVDGAIYFKAMAAAQENDQIRSVIHDPMLKTHVIMDLGFNDATAIILAQVVRSEVRIIHYIEGNQRTLSDYHAELRGLRFNGQAVNWGTMCLPHDGFAKRHQTGTSDAEVMQRLGWSVSQVPNEGVRMGIERARELFPRLFIDKKCERLIECLKRYRWRPTNANGGESASPLHDEFSHGADALRYLALTAPQLSNDDWGGEIEYNNEWVA